MASYLRETAAGVELLILVQPRSSQSRVVGEHEGRLKIRVTSPPVDGQANDEVIELLARRMGQPRKNIAIDRGETSRRKTVTITGASLAEITRCLEAAP
jgi:uncharacterized protein (TIGR00251 family)